MSATKTRTCVRCRDAFTPEKTSRLCEGCRTVGVERACRECDSAFHDHTGNLYKCYECRAAYQRNYDDAGYKLVRRNRVHGLPPGTIEAMELEQGGLCLVCGLAAELVVDHDRSCCDFMPRANNPACGKCVRGLICRTCNAGMGQFGDDPDRLMAAAAYLLSRSDVLAEIRTLD